MNYEAFTTALTNSLATEKQAREDGEQKLLEWQKRQPNEFIEMAIQILKADSREALRQQAVISIRTLLRDFTVHNTSDSTWMQLSAATKDVLLGQLLTSLATETAKSTRSYLCDVISDLGCRLVPAGQWPQLIPAALELLNRDEPHHKASGLKLVSEMEMCDTFDQIIEYYKDQLMPIIKAGIQHVDDTVRLECLNLISAIVGNLGFEIRYELSELVPTILTGLETLVPQQDKQMILLEYLTTIADMSDKRPAFFSRHLELFTHTMMGLARCDIATEDPRQMAVEILLSSSDQNPKMMMSVDKFVENFVRLLMEFLLCISDDPQWAQRDSEMEEDEESSNYDVGEKGLDRCGLSFGGEVVTPAVFAVVEEFMKKPEWQYTCASIVAISQTVEYLPEKNLEEYLDIIVNILLANLTHQHCRVRHAACQAIGQISLDHQPYFQQNYSAKILPALITTIEDPVLKVSGHAISAFVNFVEEMDKVDFLPVKDQMMQILNQRIDLNHPRVIREPSVTAIAVIAGVLGEEFLPYYGQIVPTMKNIIVKCDSKEERTCRGKAIECLSVIGLSMGLETFQTDAAEVMEGIISLMKLGFEPDDPVKEYIMEALRRMCRTLKTHFAPYLSKLLPFFFQTLASKPEVLDEDDIDERYKILEMANGKCQGIRTHIIDDMEITLELLRTILEVLGSAFEPYVATTLEVLLPLLYFEFNDEIEALSINVIAECIQCIRDVAEKKGASKETVTRWLVTTAEKVFEKSKEKSTECLTRQTDGLSKCLQAAGPNVLSAEQVKTFCAQVFSLIQESSKRREENEMEKTKDTLDEVEIQEINSQQEIEQMFRSTLLEIIGALMSHHADAFMLVGTDMCMSFWAATLHQNASADDKALALYICCDVLEKLGQKGLPLWPEFIDKLVNSISSEAPAVCQAACYGVTQAAKYPQFADFVPAVVNRLLQVVQDPNAKSDEAAAALDNAVAALGDVAILHPEALVDFTPEKLLQTWLSKLPLKQDQDEGTRVHKQLVELVSKNNAAILGSNNQNLPQVINIFLKIYDTQFASEETSKEIRNLINQLEPNAVNSIAQTLTRKQQNKLLRIKKPGVV